MGIAHPYSSAEIDLRDEEEEGCADWRNRVGSAEVAEAGGAPPLLLPVQFQMQQQREQAAAGCWNLPDRLLRAELDIWKRMSRNTFLCRRVVRACLSGW